MWLVYDNIAVFMTALVACVFAWLYGGTIHQANVTVIPWLLLFLVDIMMCFPQRHRGESIYDARERVWYNMKRDPLVWVALVFLVLMLVPFVNKGLCPICDYTAVTLKGVPAAPPIPLAPFCVDRQDHLAVLLWFAPALASMVAVKHSLLKRGKRAVLAIIVANGLGLSLIGLVQRSICAGRCRISFPRSAIPTWAEIISRCFSAFPWLCGPGASTARPPRRQLAMPMR